MENMPKSQLAIRRGGNWQEQTCTVDKQGDIIIVSEYLLYSI